MERFDSCWEFSDFSPKPPVSLTEKEKHLSNVLTRLKTQYHISIIAHNHALTDQSHKYCRVFVHEPSSVASFFGERVLNIVVERPRAQRSHIRDSKWIPIWL